LDLLPTKHASLTAFVKAPEGAAGTAHWSRRWSGGFLLEAPMHKDRLERTVRIIAGRVKGIVGQLFGDANLEASGKLDEVQGTIQNSVGRVKEALDEDPRRGT
jgi:uncharacterized protein YjbJ (UPF0337 family)